MSVAIVSPQGARSRRDTVHSLPFGIFTKAYCGLAWISSTVSTMGSYLLFLTFFLSSTGPGFTHDGKDVPLLDLLTKLKNLSCGVQLVDVHNSVLILGNSVLILAM